MTFGRLVLKLGWMLRGNRPFAAFRQLQRHRRMSPADLKTMQNELLRKVIRHAYEQTPYYAELFRRHSLTPDDGGLPPGLVGPIMSGLRLLLGSFFAPAWARWVDRALMNDGRRTLNRFRLRRRSGC